VEIGTMNMSELHSVKALLDCRATRSLIDRDFVHSREMNTQTLLRNIPVFNVDSSPNKTEQISCYESPKKKQVSHVFKHLIANIKSYNEDKI